MSPWRLVAVAGGGMCSDEEYDLARNVGRLLAEAGVAVLSGGLGGVMEACARGACEAGGLTVGLLPGRDPREANPYVRVPIATGLGELRNYLIAESGDALIAVGGEFGALSEIAMALKLGKRVVGLSTWRLAKEGGPVNAIRYAQTPEDAVRLALDDAGS